MEKSFWIDLVIRLDLYFFRSICIVSDRFVVSAILLLVPRNNQESNANKHPINQEFIVCWANPTGR